MLFIARFFIFLMALVHWNFLCSFCADNETDNWRYAEDDLEETHGKIIFSSVIFRHGDRTIKARYPTDPYPDSVWGGRLQLTKRGKEQVYNLGKWYRKRYSQIVGTGYNSSLVLMNSTNTDRALMSAELFLAGMFPPTEDELWSDDGLKWQPVPVHTNLKELNNIIGDAPCARYDKERQYWSSSSEVQLFYQRFQETIEYVCQQANYTTCTTKDIFSTCQNIWTVYNALYIEELNGFKLPKWTRKIYPEPSRTISAFYFLSKTYSLEMRRLKGGPIIRNIIEEMEEKRAETLDRIVHFYSGQETTIAIFLHTLDLYDFMIPSYTASIMVELRQKGDQFYVTILYRNDTNRPPRFLRVPNCGIHCTLDEFKEVTKYLMVHDWYQECRVGLLEKIYTSSFIYAGIIALFCVVGVAIITIAHFGNVKKYNAKINYEHL